MRHCPECGRPYHRQHSEYSDRNTGRDAVYVVVGLGLLFVVSVCLINGVW
jgi:hypothetical protein